MSDLREQARAVAVEAVDRATGYTLEHSSSPELHRHFYDTVEEHVFMALLAAEKRAKDAEEAKASAYAAAKLCADERDAALKAVTSQKALADRLGEALAASQALTQRTEERASALWNALHQAVEDMKDTRDFIDDAELDGYDEGETDFGPLRRGITEAETALAESPDHVAPARVSDVRKCETPGPIPADAEKGESHVALPDGVIRWNNGVRCDMQDGPCACGSWHSEASSAADHVAPAPEPLMARYRRTVDERTGEPVYVLIEAQEATASPAPECHVCRRPATCIGRYEAMEDEEQEQPACDDCCGHGNEDGHCRPIAAPPEEAAHQAQDDDWKECTCGARFSPSGECWCGAGR